MTKYVTLICSLFACGFITWIFCIFFLNDIINIIFENISHEDKINYWFYSFITIEILFCTVIFIVINKSKIFNK
jgi:hypothetical protein